MSLQFNTHTYREDTRRYQVIALCSGKRLLRIHSLTGCKSPQILTADVQSYALQSYMLYPSLRKPV